MKQRLSFWIALLPIISCSTTHKKVNTSPIVNDDHSFSNPNEVVVEHIDLNLKVDFEKHQLKGTAVLTIKNHSGADTLHLDTSELMIKSVLLDSNQTTPYTLRAAHPIFGSDLAIAIDKNTRYVTIAYETSPQAKALQWLNPEQTAGKKYPFLYTQSQAILARSWIPLQDAPNVRFTWTAQISCPQELMALMSCPVNERQKSNGTYFFNMPFAVPSYLMALAVGDINYAAYDNRSGIYAEPVILQKAFAEFKDLPKMISAAESLYGAYPWQRYDVLVLPPSFPFGGMENPCLTFATPTIITGDGSLVSLIAHELAHSWSGNLVTNATWNDFWLNEGFTVYFESRIMEKIYGKDYADMLAQLAMNELKNTLNDIGPTHPDTKLFLDLKGRDPDDGVSDIAYEKGRFLLATIEQTVGRNAWDSFLKKYFDTFRFQSMTTEKFIDYINHQLLNQKPNYPKKVQLNEWIYEPGLPKHVISIKSVYLEQVESQAQAFLKNPDSPIPDTTGWTTHHYLHFLRTVAPKIDLNKVAILDAHFKFTASTNSEIAFDWFNIALTCKYQPAYAAIEHFLMTVGRRKFIAPLYRKAANDPELKIWAETIYHKARPGYHSVSRRTIDEFFQTN
jgi:aminopeptidase N